MARRGAALEVAILGLLADSPMHGYELRKRVNVLLGRRLLSFGTLYPCLKGLLRDGYVSADAVAPDHAEVRAPKRQRIVYTLTAAGKDHLNELLADAGPTAWNDENFEIRFALFSRTASPTRVRILEGRRSRLEEHVESLRSSNSRSRARMDAYTRELQRHGLESTEREISWLSQLIDKERQAQAEPDRGENLPQHKTSEELHDREHHR